MRTSRDRGRRQSRERLHPEQPRDTSVSPSRPVKPGPQPPPFPTQPPSSSYDPSTGYYGVPSTSSALPTVYSGYAHAEEYADGRRSTGSSQNSRGGEILITIKRKSFWATLGSSRDSFICAELVDDLKLGRKSTNACRFTDPDSRKTYECRERIRTDIEPTGRAKLKDVKLYIIPRRSSLKYSIILGTDSMGPLDTVGTPSQDYASSSIDSGYGTANSRPQFNLPLRTVDRTISSTAASSANYSGTSFSSSPVYNHGIYSQKLPSVQETPSSSYPREAERRTSPSYYPSPDQSSHETYAESYPVESEQKQDSEFLGYKSGTPGVSESDEGGMGYNFPQGGDENYSLHSNSHGRNSAYITPRPSPPGDGSQTVYSSTSDDTMYAVRR